MTRRRVSVHACQMDFKKFDGACARKVIFDDLKFDHETPRTVALVIPVSA